MAPRQCDVVFSLAALCVCPGRIQRRSAANLMLGKCLSSPGVTRSGERNCVVERRYRRLHSALNRIDWHALLACRRACRDGGSLDVSNIHLSLRNDVPVIRPGPTDARVDPNVASRRGVVLPVDKRFHGNSADSCAQPRFGTGCPGRPGTAERGRRTCSAAILQRRRGWQLYRFGHRALSLVGQRDQIPFSITEPVAEHHYPLPGLGPSCRMPWRTNAAGVGVRPALPAETWLLRAECSIGIAGTQAPCNGGCGYNPLNQLYPAVSHVPPM